MEEFDASITEWTNWAQTNGQYDIALFKIWIKFENIVTYVFKTYCTGQFVEEKSRTYNKLIFADETQLNAFLSFNGKKHIDYYDCVNKLSKYIFDPDPFIIITSDKVYTKICSDVFAIRNCVAHESGSAKDKYIMSCLGNHKDKYVEPNEYLKQKDKNTNKSKYLLYTDGLRQIVCFLTCLPDEYCNSSIDEN